MKSQTIVGRDAGPHLLITGGVHGDEFAPMAAIRRLMAMVGPASVRGQLTLVPVVNEAAFARGNRVAEDGLDLARTCPGRADGSITEQTAYALSQLIHSADYFIDLHTGGLALQVWPLAGYMLHPAAAVLEKQRAMARAFNLPVVWGTDCRLEGRSLSVARDANVAAIYVEYLGGGGYSREGVAALTEGCLNVMGLLGMMDRAQESGHEGLPEASQVRLIVEDSRPGSGYMQRCHPSPANGFFEAAVELGQPIAAGQSLGRVVEPLGREAQEICAAETGHVLVLRSLPSVQKGDSLAVILPGGTGC